MRIVDALIVALIGTLTTVLSYFINTGIIGVFKETTDDAIRSELSGTPLNLYDRIFLFTSIGLGLFIILTVIGLWIYYYMEAQRREDVIGVYGGTYE